MSTPNFAVSRITTRLVHDDRGTIISIEVILIATIAVLGLVVGFTAIRDALLSEISDSARAVQNVVQSYAYHGVSGHSSSTAGSDYADNGDHCNSGWRDRANRITNCIQIRGVADEGTVLAP